MFDTLITPAYFMYQQNEIHILNKILQIMNIKQSSLTLLAFIISTFAIFTFSCQKDPVDGFIDQDLKKEKKEKEKLVDSAFAIDAIFDSTFQLEDIINTDGPGAWHKGIPIGLFRRCFELVPPVTLIYPGDPDSTQVTYEGLTELKKDLKIHFDESDEIPEVVYPVTLKLKDGTLLEIPDQETLFNTLFTCLPFKFFEKFLNGDDNGNENGNGNGNNGKGNGNGG